METDYLASISNILQKKTLLLVKKKIKKILGDLVFAVVGQKTVRWQFWLLLRCHTDEQHGLKKSEPVLSQLSFLALQNGYNPGEAERVDFTKAWALRSPLDQVVFTGRRKGEACSNGKLGTVQIIFFLLAVLFPAKTWHGGVSEFSFRF